jgi:hypothetical protein
VRVLAAQEKLGPAESLPPMPGLKEIVGSTLVSIGSE